MLGLRVLDHVIIGENDFASIFDMGFMSTGKE